jgi:regulation of enolase protein 1 (concanavalin A-like superfamily)
MKQMMWFNEPDKWTFESEKLSMQVTPKTDFWRLAHYGFTVDDGPFFYCMRGGEFEMMVKIRGQFKTRFDQMGLMIRLNEYTWIKAGVEYVDNKVNLSTVATHTYSDWSISALDYVPEHLWFRMIRSKDAVEVAYSLEGERYHMMRLAYFPQHQPLMAGMFAACPDGEGFEAIFEEFSITHLPDSARLKWLKENSSKD